MWHVSFYSLGIQGATQSRDSEQVSSPGPVLIHQWWLPRMLCWTFKIQQQRVTGPCSPERCGWLLPWKMAWRVAGPVMYASLWLSHVYSRSFSLKFTLCVMKVRLVLGDTVPGSVRTKTRVSWLCLVFDTPAPQRRSQRSSKLSTFFLFFS